VIDAGSRRVTIFVTKSRYAKREIRRIAASGTITNGASWSARRRVGRGATTSRTSAPTARPARPVRLVVSRSPTRIRGGATREDVPAASIRSGAK
jgi:hypothetical protein